MSVHKCNKKRKNLNLFICHLWATKDKFYFHRSSIFSSKGSFVDDVPHQLANMSFRRLICLHCAVEQNSWKQFYFSHSFLHLVVLKVKLVLAVWDRSSCVDLASSYLPRKRAGELVLKRPHSERASVLPELLSYSSQRTYCTVSDTYSHSCTWHLVLWLFRMWLQYHFEEDAEESKSNIHKTMHLVRHEHRVYIMLTTLCNSCPLQVLTKVKVTEATPLSWGSSAGNLHTHTELQQPPQLIYNRKIYVTWF